MSVAASVRFIRRAPLATLGVYALDWSLVAVVTTVYVILGPGSNFRFGPDSPVWWTVAWWIAVNQLYVLARLWLRTVFWASEASLFQSQLAHAGYVATRMPEWPESPSVEALGAMEQAARDRRPG